MIDEQIYRRFNHTIAACFVVFFLFPSEILGLQRSYFIVFFWLLVVSIEIARLTKGIKILGMREYEKDRIASFVWFASGSCLLIGLYEIGFFPQSLVIATIIMAAYTDPVIGEATKKWGDKNGIMNEANEAAYNLKNFGDNFDGTDEESREAYVEACKKHNVNPDQQDGIFASDILESKLDDHYVLFDMYPPAVTTHGPSPSAGLYLYNFRGE